ncbi:hypothetical protein BC826DRAFT_480935 [Russula brevipes]|nr:hypothetical protein BC826DRAFT_480935 [Russula brevipes]
MALIRSPKATLVRCGGLISTKGEAAIHGPDRVPLSRSKTSISGRQPSSRGVKQPTISELRAGCRLTDPQSARLPTNPHGMPSVGLPGAPSEEADEGGGARATADGAHPARGDSDAPKDPRDLERALASAAVDWRLQDSARSKPGAGPTGLCKGMRPSHDRARSQRTPRGTRDVEGEPPWKGISEH